MILYWFIYTTSLKIQHPYQLRFIPVFRLVILGMLIYRRQDSTLLVIKFNSWHIIVLTLDFHLDNPLPARPFDSHIEQGLTDAPALVSVVDPDVPSFFHLVTLSSSPVRKSLIYGSAWVSTR